MSDLLKAIPRREEMPSKNLYAGIMRLANARKELTEAQQDFERLSAEFRDAYGFVVSEPQASIHLLGDPPMMDMAGEKG